MSVIKVCCFCLAGILTAVLIKQDKAEFGMLVSFGICIVMIGVILDRFSLVFSMIEQLRGQLKMSDTYLKILLKMVGITYVAEFTSDLCLEAGYQGIAKQIQIFGKISILVLGVPVIAAFVELMTEILS